MQSEPLTLKAGIEGETGFAAVVSVLKMFFDRIVTFFERLFSEPSQSYGFLTTFRVFL